MKEQTIYSYKLVHRFRWRLVGYLLQILLLLGCFYITTAWLSIPFAKLLISSSIVVLVPVQHFLLFRLFTYFRSQPPKLSPDMLFSAWWGASTAFPLSLSVFLGAELTVCLGSLLFSAALFVWLPIHYGITLLVSSLILALPRVLAMNISLRQTKDCRVKYETRSVAFLLTDG